MTTVSPAWRAFHLPRQGHTLEEYEDAFAGAPERGRFAVADGASESAFAGDWARLVVQAYVQTPGPWSAWLPAARQRWHAEVSRHDLPWYLETKVEEGAFAALLGLALTGRRWRAEAVGDSCVFLVRGPRLLRAFPLDRSGAFGNRPSLLGSRRRGPGQPRARRFRRQGRCRPGDDFFLMTDALAQWFLQQTEQGGRPWDDVRAVAGADQFAGWVAQLRATGKLRNDDVTLGYVHVPNS
jgi:hypothetical protein